MTILDFLPLFAGIGLFLYGMNLLAKAIENLAGAKLEQLLEKLTSNKWKGLALGTSAHAIGTAKALELGEVEGAMSSLSIVVAGLLTVVGASVFANFM